MIKSFRSKHAEDLFHGGFGHRSWGTFRRVARRKLLMVDAANTLSDLKTPPDNKLEALKRDRDGQHAIRVNQQYRVCFRWIECHAYDIEVVDDH